MIVEKSEDTAREEIAMLTQWDSDPSLTIEELAYLTRVSRRPDIFGFFPTGRDGVFPNPNWTPTFDITPSLAKGWMLKLSKAVTCGDFRTREISIKRSQIVANCKLMADYWKKHVNQTITLPGSLNPYQGPIPVEISGNINLAEIDILPYL